MLFPDVFSTILHTSLALMLLYCKYRFIVMKLITLKIQSESDFLVFWSVLKNI
jgi:hypothetical protein